jgi:hypothetical protein
MEYVRLGKTGLKVSRIALGCMSYGDPKSTSAHLWSLDDEDAQPFFRQAVELGVTFWDTANVYQHGTSEELVGRAITRYSRREEIVLATKVHGKMHDGPGGQGLSARPSWSRSTPRWPGSGPTTSTSTRSMLLKRRTRPTGLPGSDQLPHLRHGAHGVGRYLNPT